MWCSVETQCFASLCVLYVHPGNTVGAAWSYPDGRKSGPVNVGGEEMNHKLSGVFDGDLLHLVEVDVPQVAFYVFKTGFP